MRLAYLVTCLLIRSLAQSQNFILPQGEYMDTTLAISPKCDFSNLFYYYECDGRYPESASTLLNNAKEFIGHKGKKHDGSGYITLRFIVDCEGIIHKVKIVQADEDYKPYRFSKDFVNDLNDYIHTLNKWKKNVSIQNYKNINYIAYISFKIRNGEIVNVIN